MRIVHYTILDAQRMAAFDGLALNSAAGTVFQIESHGTILFPLCFAFSDYQ